MPPLFGARKPISQKYRICFLQERNFSQLPAAGRIVCRMLPLTRSIQAMNLLFCGEKGRFPALLFGELGIAAVYVLLSRAILDAAERASCKSGRFDMF